MEQKEDSFNKLLQIYKDIVKFILGLASGSIVLIVSFLSFNKLEKLAINFATPLYLLLSTIIYGILFIVFLILDYESYQHDNESYGKFKYSKNIAFGYSSLVCFIIGYV